MYRYSLILALLVALPLSAAAQHAGEAASGRYSRHSLTVQMGLFNWATVETSVTAGGVTTDTRTNGLVGALSYAYWAVPDWAVTVSAGVLVADTGTSVSGAGVMTDSAVIVPLLFGAKYAPARSPLGPSLRPYVSGAVGPYLGFSTVSYVGFDLSEETISETAFGFRALAGADWFLSSHFKMGIGAGYHFVTDFDEPIGLDDNYSGPEFSIGVGFGFGRGQ